MKKEKIYSLYVHIFPNNKVYVGITSQKPKVRWGYTGVNYKAQPYLWSAIQKYGWNNIQHVVILQTKFKDEIEKQEKYFITEVYHSNEKDKGYNIAQGGSQDFSQYNNGIKPAEGRHWYTNGIDNLFLKEEDTIPEGYYRGCTCKSRGNWWTDGIEQCISKECPGDGWHLGKLPVSEEFRDKLKGKNNPMYNTNWYTDGITNIIIKKDDQIPEGFKQGMTIQELKGENNPAYGKYWWNNGIEQKLQKECPGDDWIKGQLPVKSDDNRHKSPKNKNTKVYNNGTTQCYFSESDIIPEGWIKGALPMSEDKKQQKLQKIEQYNLEHYGVKNYAQTEEMKKFASEKIKGENNPMYGKTIYTNGKENIILKKDDPIPEDFVQITSYQNKGKKWWNNGEKSVFRFEKPDDTYKPGRLEFKHKKRR